MERAHHAAPVLRLGRKLNHKIPVNTHIHINGNLAPRRAGLDLLLERGVDVAVQTYPGAQAVDTLAKDAQTLAPVSPETGYRILINEGEAVAVG